MFITPLHVEWLRGDSDSAKLLYPLRYKRLYGPIIEVPTGFITDFASVPRFFWRIFPPTGEYRDAAVIHDYLYATNGLQSWDRKTCDQIFLEAMFDLRVARWKRYLIHKAVRLGGRGSWEKYKQTKGN